MQINLQEVYNNLKLLSLPNYASLITLMKDNVKITTEIDKGFS